MSTENKYKNCNLEFWGGIECTINRVKNSYFDQLDLSGHYTRETDIEMIAALGVKVLRYPVMWEKHQPQINKPIDWSYTTQTLEKLTKCGITPIVGLLHHGSGPRFTNLLDPNFPQLLANYAREVAQQFPWINYYTPVNEPLTTARFSGLYGLWYPHISNDVSFAKMLFNQVKGIILSMKEIRKINPSARLIQTEDLSKTFSTSLLKYQAAFENERRWLTYDLLCGKVQPGHMLWDYFIRLGIKEETLNFFIGNATPPDIMGFNYYVTSERYLDHNTQNYPTHTHGGNEVQNYADVEAIRINHGNPFGLSLLLQEAWKRYGLPIAITEAHLNSGREDQLRWLKEIIEASREAIESGVNVKAVTFWSLFGAYGWNRLLTHESMAYEPGAFDLRSTKPRPTAIADFVRSVTSGTNYEPIVPRQKGWWHQKSRFYSKQQLQNISSKALLAGQPLLIIGRTGTLGQAFARMCDNRNLKYILTGREILDITNEDNIKALLDFQNPWAVINTAGFVKVDEAEEMTEQCFAINAIGPELLAKACKERNISLVSFSSDLVFNGQKKGPYIETDEVAPLNVYGFSKRIAEEKILKENSTALVIRTSAFFGPRDRHNFAFSVLNSLSQSEIFLAPDDLKVSPTYVPHLVSATMELLIDKESGIWHLANVGGISWKDFALRIARKAGYDESLIRGSGISSFKLKAIRPHNSVLRSERGSLMPSLDNAIECFFEEYATLPIEQVYQ